MICIEDSRPELARDFATAGAQLLVAVINTEPFHGTALPLQHLGRTRLTSVAVGLPKVHCVNSGISCSIDRLG